MLILHFFELCHCGCEPPLSLPLHLLRWKNTLFQFLSLSVLVFPFGKLSLCPPNLYHSIYSVLAIYPFKHVSKATMFTLGLCVGSLRVPLSLIYNTNKIWIVSYFLRLISNHIKKVYQLNALFNKQLSCQTLSLISDSHKMFH